MYAFPLITGRGQWLPLHNGFASASHLLPASLGEEEVKEEEEWRETGTKSCWLVNQTWPCEDTHTRTDVSHLWSSMICLETNTYPIVKAKQEDVSLRKRNNWSPRPWSELCLTAKEAVKRGITTKEALSYLKYILCSSFSSKPHSSSSSRAPSLYSRNRKHQTPKFSFLSMSVEVRFS